MKNLKDLFVHQLKDLFSAETQLIGALPEMINQAKTPNLNVSFNRLATNLSRWRN